jgi:hypothetical protein
MKSFASLKVVPYIGLALVAIMKGLKNRKEGASKLQVLDKNQNVYLEGKITKNLKDSFGYICQISTPTSSLWVASENELPAVGQEVGFELGKRFDAYESVQLGMAFECVYFITKMGLISEYEKGPN